MSTNNKTIDSYNKYANKWVRYKRDGSFIYHLYLEKPAIYSKLPNLKDKNVLCLGCGSGEEVDYLHSLGAKKVIGIDIAEKMVEIAKKSYPNLEFYVMDIEKLAFPPNSFDLVFSSLTIHYLKNWTKALNLISKVLKNDGIFLFSITHPFFSATIKREDNKIKSRMLGSKDIKGNDKLEIYGNYFDCYKVGVKINNKLIVINYHQPLNKIITEITKARFSILDILEPKALLKAKDKYPKFWKIHQKIPEFMVFKLRKTVHS